ncbi:MAG: hypothetical protein U0871_29605 [Gemmataceae bacterium]
MLAHSPDESGRKAGLPYDPFPGPMTGGHPAGPPRPLRAAPGQVGTLNEMLALARRPRRPASDRHAKGRRLFRRFARLVRQFRTAVTRIARLEAEVRRLFGLARDTYSRGEIDAAVSEMAARVARLEAGRPAGGVR